MQRETALELFVMAFCRTQIYSRSSYPFFFLRPFLKCAKVGEHKRGGGVLRKKMGKKREFQGDRNMFS